MTDEELEKYNVIIAQLRLVEDPVEQYEPINEVMTRITAGNQRYITRRTVDAFMLTRLYGIIRTLWQVSVAKK